jgi:hypothetical protein
MISICTCSLEEEEEEEEDMAISTIQRRERERARSMDDCKWSGFSAVFINEMSYYKRHCSLVEWGLCSPT